MKCLYSSPSLLNSLVPCSFPGYVISEQLVPDNILVSFNE